jgi:hypothetical protein
VLVVVIVGGIIGLITFAVVREDQQPATPPEAPDREAVPEPEAERDAVLEPAFPAAEAERIPAFTGAQHLATEPVEPLAPSWGQRARAAGLLGLTVVVLGSLAAGLAGAVLYVGVRALDRALG